MKIETITSQDGIEYRVLTTPSEVNLIPESIKTHDSFSDGYKIHHLYVKCEEIKNCKLPLESNPREPTKADVVKKMINTLHQAPQFFHHWNNGISVIIDEIQKINGNEYQIKFREGDGVCNGGHTYFAIETMETEINSKALVHLELIQLPTECSGQTRLQTIIDIAEKRNRNRQLLESTQADYLNYYNPFKMYLDKNKVFVKWHEGDSEADRIRSINSEHFIRLLTTIDPHWYDHPVINPRGGLHNAARSVKAIHSKWYEGVENKDPERDLYAIGVFSKELFKIRDIISYSLKNDDFTAVSQGWRNTNFYSWLRGWREEKLRKLEFYHAEDFGLDIPPTADVIFIGTFRYNVWIGKDSLGETKYVGWLKDPLDLWESTKTELIKRLTRAFGDSENDAKRFVRKESPYENQLIEIMYGMGIPNDPVRFYDISDIENVIRYKKEETNPTHFLEYVPDPPIVELKAITGALPQGTTGYVSY